MKSINDKELRFEAIMRELRENFLDAFAMLESCPVCKEEFDPSLMVDGVLICERHGRFVVTWTDGTPDISWHFRVQPKEMELPVKRTKFSRNGGLGEYFWDIFHFVGDRKDRQNVKWRNVQILYTDNGRWSFLEMTDDGAPLREWVIPEHYHKRLELEVSHLQKTVWTPEDPTPSTLVVPEKVGLGKYFWELFLLVTAGLERETVQWENVIIICVRRDIFIFREMTEDGGVRQEWTIPDEYHEELRRELAKIPIRPA